MVASTELYDILGVAPDAGADEIKRAYKKLAIKYHPDKQAASEDQQNKDACEAKFKEISEAYSILGQPDKRKAYDIMGTREGAGGGGDNGFPFGGGGGMPDFSEIFSDIFGGGGGGGNPFEHFFTGGGGGGEGCKLRPDYIDVDVTMEELRKGGTRKVVADIHDKCDACSGIGAKDASDVIKCISCNGRGIVLQQIASVMITQMQCPSCGGQGETIRHNRVCGTCHGRKRRSIARSFDIRIPAGVPNNCRYELPSKGSYHPDAKRNADIVLRFVHVINPSFKIDTSTNDVHTTLKVSIDDVFCGFEKKISVYGNIYRLKRTKYFNPRTPSRIKGMGIPAFKTKSYGDMVIHYDVGFPTDPPLVERLERYKTAFMTIFKRPGPSPAGDAGGVGGDNTSSSSSNGKDRTNPDGTAVDVDLD